MGLMIDILSIGLTVGAAVSGVVQFFCITFPGARLNWWGDGLGCPLQPLPVGGSFGPVVCPLHLGRGELTEIAWRISVIARFGNMGLDL
jgi:hypothetical protein